MTKRALWLAAALPLAASAQEAPSLAVPVDCEIGKTCIVQNYVDGDPGPEARDYRCGFLTYDGHKGTDIRVIDAEALRRGVAVLAAESGRVRAERRGRLPRRVRARSRRKEAHRARARVQARPLAFRGERGGGRPAGSWR